MKSFRRWAMAAAVALAGCGDGGIQSPDFTPLITVENLTLEPATAQELPIGTTLSLVAKATVSQTVPPGTVDGNGNPISKQTSIETVTAQAGWASENSAVASVSEGLVRGIAVSSNPVTITASFQGKTASVDVTVTDAVLNAVEYVKPQGVLRTLNDTYSVTANSTVPFEIYGRFSDDSVRQLTPPSFTAEWLSDATTVANNSANNNVFSAIAVGTAHITGRITNVAATPAAATATLNVVPFSDFCESLFLAPTAGVITDASDLCIGCLVEQPELIIDSSEDSYAKMNIPLGLLLQSSVSATVFTSGTSPLVVGRPTGFVISKISEQLLSAELLAELTIDTVHCDAGGANCEVLESFSGESGTLSLALLGMLDDSVPHLVLTEPLTAASANANGIRLTFDGGLLTALATLNVHSACGIATPPAE